MLEEFCVILNSLNSRINICDKAWMETSLKADYFLDMATN